MTPADLTAQLVAELEQVPCAKCGLSRNDSRHTWGAPIRGLTQHYFVSDFPALARVAQRRMVKMCEKKIEQTCKRQSYHGNGTTCPVCVWMMHEIRALSPEAQDPGDASALRMTDESSPTRSDLHKEA